MHIRQEKNVRDCEKYFVDDGPSHFPETSSLT